MKYLVSSFAQQMLVHVCHALAVLLACLVVFERLVPGAVLGHFPLFLAVPLLILCIAVHPAAHKPARWWSLVDLWVIVALCIGQIYLRINQEAPFAWVLTGFATALVFAFLWIFSHDPIAPEV